MNTYTGILGILWLWGYIIWEHYSPVNSYIDYHPSMMVLPSGDWKRKRLQSAKLSILIKTFRLEGLWEAKNMSRYFCGIRNSLKSSWYPSNSPIHLTLNHRRVISSALLYVPWEESICSGFDSVVWTHLKLLDVKTGIHGIPSCATIRRLASQSYWRDLDEAVAFLQIIFQLDKKLSIWGLGFQKRFNGDIPWFRITGQKGI